MAETSPTSPSSPTPADSAPASADTLRSALLALNRLTSPWQVRDGAPEQTDLVVEWRIADARWYEIFAKASLTKVFRVFLLLDEGEKTVRALDEEWNVEWYAGVPRLGLATQVFRGQKMEISFGTAAAFTEEISPGVVYSYRFSTEEIKGPVTECIQRLGWKFDGVLSRSAVTRSMVGKPIAAEPVAVTAEPSPFPGASSPLPGATSPPAPIAVPPAESLVRSAVPAMVPAGVVPQGSNPLAVAGLVCGILGLTPYWVGFVLCILAIVFSSVGLSRAPKVGGVGRGLAIAGLVLGLVFILPAACGL